MLGFVWTPEMQTMTPLRPAPPRPLSTSWATVLIFLFFYYYRCSFKYSPLENGITNGTLEKVFLLNLKGLTTAFPPSKQADCTADDGNRTEGLWVGSGKNPSHPPPYPAHGPVNNIRVQRAPATLSIQVKHCH